MRKRSKNACEPLFSDEDADLRLLTWSLDGTGYPCRTINFPRREKRKCLHVLAHQEVIFRMTGRRSSHAEPCDHINGIKTDARRENLRLTTRFGNAQNRGPHGPVGIRGVSFCTRTQKYQASVKHKGKAFHCGTFTTKEEAGRAAADKRRELGFLGEPA